MRWAVPRYRRASERLQEAESGLTGLLVDSYANADTLALLGGQDTRAEHDRRVFALARRAHLNLQRVEVTMNGTMMALGSALLAEARQARDRIAPELPQHACCEPRR
jgi:ATP-binding cassette subfamily B multidrug efflux pump